MLGFQREKGIVRDYYQALDNADIYEVDITLKRFTSENYTWRAFHPFNLQTDVKAVSDTFWKPFLTSFTYVRRRMDVFFAGNNFFYLIFIYVFNIFHFLFLYFFQRSGLWRRVIASD